MKLRLIPLFLIGIYATGSMAAPAAGVPAASDKALPVLASVPGTPAAAAAPAPAADRITEVITAELPAPNIDVWTRIRNGFKIPTLESARVETQVAAISRHPESFAKTATRAGMYLYHIVGQVEARGMPMELALLPFVESSFRPNALSSAKASGLWQFIPSTGTTYSLNQNLWKDERRDVVESTRAALDYFQKLYAQFGDWQLALAAATWGEGNVQRAIDRNAQAGLPTDYSHLRMPLETANYVPRLEAVKRIIQNPSAYGVTLPDIGSEPYFVQVFRDKDIDVKTAARLANMKLDDFKLLNPSFNKPVIVGAHNTAMLIPADNLDEFMENLALWRSNGKRVSAWKTHRFQKGETLADIALGTGMSEEELREVNRIPGNRQVADNSLLLVRADAESPREEIQGGNDFFRLEPVPSVPKIRYRQIRYRVRKGDTLEEIADRLNVTPRSIIVTNRLRNSKLRRGMTLIVTAPVIQRAPDMERVNSERIIYRTARRYRLNAMPRRGAKQASSRTARSRKASSAKSSRAKSSARKTVKRKKR